MPVSAKPISYTAGAATLRPNHLWMFDEGSGTTLADVGSTGGKTMTIVGADWEADGTHGPVLSFVKANSDYAHRTETGSEPVMGITTGFSLLLVLRVADLPAAVEAYAGIADSGALNVYYSVGADAQGDPDVRVRNTTATGDDNTVAAGLGDDVWHALVFTCGDSTQDTTVDGAGSQPKTLAANIADSLIDRLVIGARGDSAQIYGDLKVAAAAMWVNTQLTPTQMGDLWNSGDVWTAMGLTTGGAATKARYQAMMRNA